MSNICYHIYFFFFYKLMQRLNLQTLNTQIVPLMRYQKLVQSQAIQGNWHKWLRTLLFVVFQSTVLGCTLQKWFTWSVRLAGLGLTASVHLNIKWSFFPRFHLDQSAVSIDRKLLCNLGNFLFGEDSANSYKGFAFSWRERLLMQQLFSFFTNLDLSLHLRLQYVWSCSHHVEGCPLSQI